LPRFLHPARDREQITRPEIAFAPLHRSSHRHCRRTAGSVVGDPIAEKRFSLSTLVGMPHGLPSHCYLYLKHHAAQGKRRTAPFRDFGKFPRPLRERAMQSSGPGRWEYDFRFSHAGTVVSGFSAAALSVAGIGAGLQSGTPRNRRRVNCHETEWRFSRSGSSHGRPRVAHRCLCRRTNGFSPGRGGRVTAKYDQVGSRALAAPLRIGIASSWGGRTHRAGGAGPVYPASFSVAASFRDHPFEKRHPRCRRRRQRGGLCAATFTPRRERTGLPHI